LESYHNMSIKVVSVKYCRNTGLGNKLFPWSRALILAHKYGLGMLGVSWVSIKGAAVIRGGIDYSNLFGKQWLFWNFNRGKFEISCIKSFFLRKFTKTVLVSDFNAMIIPDLLISDTNVNICFNWNTQHNFIDLIDYRELILNSLYEQSKSKTKALYNSYKKQKFIVFNIRCGNDFITSDSKLLGYKKTPLYWFENKLIELQRSLKKENVIIISDGGKKELDILLKYENVTLFKSKKAIDDLLVMSLAKELYGSGDSTFSAWGSFLGNMPTYSWEETTFDKYCLKS
jgi:hypothetical protein